MSAAQTGENVGIRKNVGTSRESSIAFTRPERGNGNIESSKAGRACSINRKAGSAPLEEVVQTAGAKSSHTTRDKVRVNVLGGVDFTPIIRRLTIESTNAVVLSRWRTSRDDTAHFHGFVCSHKHQPLHRVSLGCLSR